MREIQYRGKDIENESWINGFYVCLNGKEHRIYSGHAETDCGDYYPDFWTVDPETVGQFTGLTDKNGKKIFEGDIVQLHGSDLPHWYSKNQNVAVKYDGSGFAPMCEYDSDCGDYVESTECEIIGNIYDNPELLEE